MINFHNFLDLLSRFVLLFVAFQLLCYQMVSAQSETKEVDCEKIQTRRVSEMMRILLRTCRMDQDTIIDSKDFSLANADENITEIYTDANLNLKYLPVNIYEKYPNLISISSWYCGLKSVSKDNFKGLTKLRRLAINQNRISIVENNTFEDLEALEWLYLDNNRIIQIDGQAIVPLINLKELTLFDNKCIGIGFFGDSVKTAPKEITDICSRYLTFQQCDALLTSELERHTDLERVARETVENCSRK